MKWFANKFTKILLSYINRSKQSTKLYNKHHLQIYCKLIVNQPWMKFTPFSFTPTVTALVGYLCVISGEWLTISNLSFWVSQLKLPFFFNRTPISKPCWWVDWEQLPHQWVLDSQDWGKVEFILFIIRLWLGMIITCIRIWIWIIFFRTCFFRLYIRVAWGETGWSELAYDNVIIYTILSMFPPTSDTFCFFIQSLREVCTTDIFMVCQAHQVSRKSRQVKKTDCSDYEKRRPCRLPGIPFCWWYNLCSKGGGRGGYKRGENTCIRTWKVKWGGGLFLGDLDCNVYCCK